MKGVKESMVQFLHRVGRWFHTLGCVLELPMGERGRRHKSSSAESPA